MRDRARLEFDRLVAKHRIPIFLLAFRAVRNQTLAERVVEGVLVRLAAEIREGSTGTELEQRLRLLTLTEATQLLERAAKDREPL